MDKFEQLKSDFQTLKSTIAMQVDVDETAFAGMVVACICAVWGANKQLYHSDYEKAVLAVTGEDYTPAQIITAMECCYGDSKRDIAIPAFLRALCEKDKENGSSYSLCAIDGLINLLIAMAFINGDFTIEEANYLSDFEKKLTGYCMNNGITGYKYSFDIQNSVTNPNDDYWREAAPKAEEAAPEEAAKEEPTAEVSESEEDDTVVVHSLEELSEVLSNAVLNVSATEQIKEKEDKKVENLARTDKAEEQTLEQLLEELDSLVGMDNIKKDVHSLLNFIKVNRLREQRGLKVPEISYHLVFTGNPGTGKTTVARLVAQLYYKMGILQKGQLVEADRSTLVAGYLGQTAIKVQEVIKSALGGVLFIDEAYSLANEDNDSYGKEAIETLLKAMEDNRDQLVVIVAGYDELMHKFIESNPGLRSRFNKYFHFKDYNGDEMLKIFERFCEKNGYLLEEKANALLKERLDALFESRDVHFGNARTVRNVFEKAINAQANRIAMLENISDDDLSLITMADIEEALEEV